MAEDKSIAVIGAGLVGPLQALFLAQAGFEVHMYEKRSDFRGTSEYTRLICVLESYTKHKIQVYIHISCALVTTSGHSVSFMCHIWPLGFHGCSDVLSTILLCFSMTK